MAVAGEQSYLKAAPDFRKIIDKESRKGLSFYENYVIIYSVICILYETDRGFRGK